jgi:drug/metabolite transporter (DMT)-like permease
MSHLETKPERTGVLLAAAAILLVGGSVASSRLLVAYPVLGGQGLRYAVAAALLAGWAGFRRQKLVRPVGSEWLWLVALAAVGLAGTSVLLIEATRITDPAAVGVVIGAAPVVIAIVYPIAAGRGPAKRVLAAAVVVAAGAASAQLGPATGQGLTVAGLLLSVGALAGVAGTSLLAVPLLPRLGGMTVSVYACALASGQLLMAATLIRLTGGPPVLRPPTWTELDALIYQAGAVTAMVFLAWFAAVQRLGVERTGLFNGLIPVTSLIAVAVSGTGTVTAVRLVGAFAVFAGLLLGLSGHRAVTRQRNQLGDELPSTRGADLHPERQGKAVCDVGALEG